MMLNSPLALITMTETITMTSIRPRKYRRGISRLFFFLSAMASLSSSSTTSVPVFLKLITLSAVRAAARGQVRILLRAAAMNPRENTTTPAVPRNLLMKSLSWLMVKDVAPLVSWKPEPTIRMRIETATAEKKVAEDFKTNNNYFVI